MRFSFVHDGRRPKMSPVSCLGVLALVLASGCTTDLKFKIVDADTREPLDGVEGVADGHVFDYILGSAKDTTVGKETANVGELQFAGLNDRILYGIVFSKPGYQPAEATCCFTLSRDIQWNSPKRERNDPRVADGTFKNASGRLIVIPLHKVPATQID